MDPRYPVGRFDARAEVSDEDLARAIEEIAEAPGRLRAAVEDLSDEQLDTPYREGGWTVRQVVHHVPDSHLNAYVRVKLALTEDEPTIKPYDQDRWAELPDGSSGPVETSLRLLEALHERWVRLLRGTPSEALRRPLHHPEIGRLTLDRLIAMYAWHGRHHVAHVTSLRERRGW